MKMSITERNYWDIDYPFKWKYSLTQLDLKIRSSIFMIIGASAGLPALVWSVGELIEHRKNGHRISVFIILLLLTDFAELYFSPYVLIKQLVNEFTCYEDWTCWILWSLWWSPRVCGLLLNQLVALEGILSVRYPLYTAAVFSSRWFRLFYILVLLGLIISGFLVITGIHHNVFPIYAFLVSVITWIISCGALCSAERRSQSSRKTDPHIVGILLINMLMLYGHLTVFVLFYILDSDMLIIVFNYSLFLMSLRLISDPLLCVLVCRQNQTSQNPEETSLSRSARM